MSTREADAGYSFGPIPGVYQDDAPLAAGGGIRLLDISELTGAADVVGTVIEVDLGAPPAGTFYLIDNVVVTTTSTTGTLLFYVGGTVGTTDLGDERDGITVPATGIARGEYAANGLLVPEGKRFRVRISSASAASRMTVQAQFRLMKRAA